jgi:hypothetical protein
MPRTSSKNHRFPYHDVDDMDVMVGVAVGSLDLRLSLPTAPVWLTLTTLARQCLDRDPDQRPTAVAALTLLRTPNRDPTKQPHQQQLAAHNPAQFQANPKAEQAQQAEQQRVVREAKAEKVEREHTACASAVLLGPVSSPVTFRKVQAPQFLSFCVYSYTRSLSLSLSLSLFLSLCLCLCL